MVQKMIYSLGGDSNNKLEDYVYELDYGFVEELCISWTEDYN